MLYPIELKSKQSYLTMYMSAEISIRMAQFLQDHGHQLMTRADMIEPNVLGLVSSFMYFLGKVVQFCITSGFISACICRLATRQTF